MASPQMMGVAPLHCGSASFHATFSLGPHLTGRLTSSLTPLADGPRQAGQLADTTADPASSPTITTLAARRAIRSSTMRPSPPSEEGSRPYTPVLHQPAERSDRPLD